LVIEFLDGDVRQTTAAVTREQREWEMLLETKCIESKKTCVELLREPQEEGRIAKLCRTGCVRRYKSVREPIVAFLKGLWYYSRDRNEAMFQLTTPEWIHTKHATLSVIRVTATRTSKNVYPKEKFVFTLRLIVPTNGDRVEILARYKSMSLGMRFLPLTKCIKQRRLLTSKFLSRPESPLETPPTSCPTISGAVHTAPYKFSPKITTFSDNKHYREHA
jgi:hypothetical protein